MLSSKLQRFFSVTNKMKARKIILAKEFKGLPTLENFKFIEESLQPLKDGEFLAQAEFLSLDPYMKLYHGGIGDIMGGEQVAKIVESKNPKFPIGEYVVAEFGWRTYSIGSNNPGKFYKSAPRLLNLDTLPRSLTLGILGHTGNTARFGFLNICKPEAGNTVVVSGASGGVGTIVGQIAKLQGCQTIAITGSDSKGKRLVEDVGYDCFVNYKSPNFEQELAEKTPKAIDCYFDNVGGEISSLILNRMNKFGRVAVCGATSTYNEIDPKAREVQTPVKVHHLTMEGFKVHRWQNEWNDGIEENKKLIQNQKLKYFETIKIGFDKIPEAFIELLKGEHFGKTIVKL